MMKGMLSKRIEARTKTIKFNWVKKDWLEFGVKFRKARETSRNPMNKCAWCHHEFSDGEMISLAQPLTGKNMILCQSCADEAVLTK